MSDLEEEFRKLKLRMTQLEISNARLTQIAVGTVQVTQQAQQGAIECSDCGNNIAAIKTCQRESCDWGFPTELETDEEAQD